MNNDVVYGNVLGCQFNFWKCHVWVPEYATATPLLPATCYLLPATANATVTATKDQHLTSKQNDYYYHNSYHS